MRNRLFRGPRQDRRNAITAVALSPRFPGRHTCGFAKFSDAVGACLPLAIDMRQIFCGTREDGVGRDSTGVER